MCMFFLSSAHDLINSDVQPIRIHFHTRIMSADETNSVIVIKQSKLIGKNI